MTTWSLQLGNLAMKIGDMLADVSREVGDAIMDLDRDCDMTATSTRVHLNGVDISNECDDSRTGVRRGSQLSRHGLCDGVVSRRLLGKSYSTYTLHQEHCRMQDVICAVRLKNGGEKTDTSDQDDDVILVCDPSSILVEASDLEFIPLSE
jgi:hypothetical protein